MNQNFKFSIFKRILSFSKFEPKFCELKILTKMIITTFQEVYQIKLFTPASLQENHWRHTGGHL